MTPTGSKTGGEERVSDLESEGETIGSILTAWEDGMWSGEDEDEEATGSITCEGAKGLINGGVEAMGPCTARGAAAVLSFTSAGAGQGAGAMAAMAAGGEEAAGGGGEGRMTCSLAAGVWGRGGATAASEAGVWTALSVGTGDGDGHTMSIMVEAATCSVGGAGEREAAGSTTGGGGGKEVTGSNREGTGRRGGGGGGGICSGLRGGGADSLIRLMTFSDSCKRVCNKCITN